MTKNFTAIVKKSLIKFTLPDLSKNDGSTINKEFWGYHRGAGCPLPIVIDIDRIEADYEDEYPSKEERSTLSQSRYFAKARRANLIRYRDTLVTVVQGLEEDDANILITTDDDSNSPGLDALVFLGWRQDPNAVQENEDSESSDEGEVVRVDETGQSQLPIPIRSTQD